uniref:Uncharacterized protein n=1 Tax=Arundo donax TaxID=35708 RepID=A0A0A9GDA0_ARUDO
MSRTMHPRTLYLIILKLIELRSGPSVVRQQIISFDWSSLK